MYKAYQSTKPCANRYLQKKWDGSDYDKHLDSLSKIKASIDTTAPQTYMHMHLKPKKLQLEEERLAVIERDNRILLEKISNVMRTKGRVDNQNDYPFCSLNREKRQREMLRVVHENKQVIKRVLETEAEFNLPKLEREWQDTLKTMDMMAHYPKDWWLLSKSKTTVPNGEKSQRGSDMRRSRTQADDGDRDNSSRASDEQKQGNKDNDKPAEKEAEKDNEGDEQAEEQEN